MNTSDSLLNRSVTTILPSKEKLVELVSSKQKLNIYLGIDPTATRIHLGHAVAIRKMQAFVDAGHNVTFLIGDFTALIGDTSDKDTERPVLTSEEIAENFKSYKEQASKLLDFSKVKVRHNSEWLSKLTFTDIVKLCQQFSVGDFVGRELIKKRLSEGKKVGLHETLYPVMQGYDSYHLDTDIQIGGADQTFNMLAGRTLIKNLKNKESFVLVTGYLEGTDGRKMSKSWGNAIWLTDSPSDMFGKIMSIKDSLIEQYLVHATNFLAEEIASKLERLTNGENPMDIKKELAFQVVKELHSEKNAKEALEEFGNTFQKRQPDFNEEIKFKSGESYDDILSPIVGSKSELKRLIKAGAIEVNGNVLNDVTTEIQTGDKIKIGKKRFLKLVD